MATISLIEDSLLVSVLFSRLMDGMGEAEREGILGRDPFRKSPVFEEDRTRENVATILAESLSDDLLALYADLFEEPWTHPVGDLTGGDWEEGRVRLFISHHSSTKAFVAEVAQALELYRRAFLKAMTRQCDRLTTIVNTLLLVSQLEAGEVVSKNTYVPLKDLMRDVIENSKDGERLQVEISGRPGLICDLFRAHHIVRNLIENACKYSPADSPVLVRASVEDGGLTVEVIDTGPGIPEGSESVIFDRFRRLTDAATSRVAGTGLGLYIARRFARDVGGDVWVSRASEDGWTGARFTVWLPEGRSTQTAA